MNSKQFFEAVAEMRRLQTNYYKTRSSLSLRAAKKQEKVIDDEIERVQRVLKTKKEQPDLFSRR